MILADGVIGSIPGGTLAAPITYDFTGPTSGTNVDLGQSEPYTVSGVTITAMAGTYFGSPPAANNASFTISSGIHLVGNNRGTDEQGLGVCGTSSGSCSGSHLTGENGEIDYGGKEVVRLDITSLFSTFVNFQINADSATDGELLGIFTSNSAISLGTKLADITSAQNNVGITPTGNYLYFVSDSSSGGGNALLHLLTVTPDPVPEPASLAEAWVEDQVRVADCPGPILVGLAESEAVGAGGGVVKEPAVHGVNEPLPQHVVKMSPFVGADGFEVCPQGSCAMIPLPGSDRFGF